MTTQTLARCFTDSDWNGFAGCEPWKPTTTNLNGSPLIREMANCIAVADRNSVGFYFCDDDGCDAQGFDLDVAFPTSAAAMIFLNGLDYDMRQTDCVSLGADHLV